MTLYGPIYEFAFDSQNGADILIVVSKKDYDGECAKRSLGKAPILKRENNGHIYGTSLEIYAECKVDGEFAVLYTSSPLEYKVQLYKDYNLIWQGYVSPELYSEPDIAPPYDVQIIATDGLGELKNYTFEPEGTKGLNSHLNYLLFKSGVGLNYHVVSSIRYVKPDGSTSNTSSDLMNIRVNLDHEAGENCYDVLQRLLASLNLNITQHNERWLLFRNTDFISLVDENGLTAYTPSNEKVILNISPFGSLNKCQWWPIGQLSTVIEPAKNKLTLTSPNNYKANVFDSEWTLSDGALYNDSEGAYELPLEGSKIVQKVNFDAEIVEYRLGIRVSARNVGSGEDEQSLGFRVVIDGQSHAGQRQYWLVKSSLSGRKTAPYLWSTLEGEFEEALSVPSEAASSADAETIDIILPLYRKDNRSFQGATSVEVTIFNPAGKYNIYVYDITLSKYEQFKGYEANVTIANGAREEMSAIDLTVLDGAKAPKAANVFMTGIPLLYDGTVITAWANDLSSSADLLSVLAKDYSKEVALPRMVYKGKLNVPRTVIPALFVRDNTYYFPRTYSYDLYNDEIEVDLISIPSADVEIQDLTITQIDNAQGGFSSSGSSGGSAGSEDEVVKPISWEDIVGKPTTLSAFTDDVGYITISKINTYAPSLTGEGATGKWNIHALALYAPWKNSPSIVDTPEALRYYATIPSSFASWCTGYNNAVLNISRYSGTGYSSQLGFSGSGLYYRHQSNAAWSNWETVAFLTSTVSAAKKIVTSGGLDVLNVTEDGNAIIEKDLVVKGDIASS